MFHPLHSYMYDVPGYPDLSCSSNMHIRVVSARFGFSKSSFSETNHPCVFDFTGQYSEGQCSASRLSLGAWGGFSRAFKKSLFFSINQVSQSFILHPCTRCTSPELSKLGLSTAAVSCPSGGGLGMWEVTTTLIIRCFFLFPSIRCFCSFYDEMFFSSSMMRCAQSPTRCSMFASRG